MALIMIVDDEVIVRQLFERVLQGQGHEVVVASNGREALTMMQMRLPDLVMLDLTMPVMDGTSFLRSMRRRPEWKNIPVIVISGVVDRHEVLRVKQLGISDYILKTNFEMNDLRQRLAKHLPKPRGAKAARGAV
jgi:CheY-like chemotaxis protein